MVLKHNRFIPQVEQCESLSLLSSTVHNVVIDHGPDTEQHVQILQRDVVGFATAERNAVSATQGAQLGATWIAREWLSHSASAGASDTAQVGPPVRVKSWARQGVSPGANSPSSHAVTVFTQSWSHLTAPTKSDGHGRANSMVAPVNSPAGPLSNLEPSAHPDAQSTSANVVPANDSGNENGAPSDSGSRGAHD
jgi:hypothetical protein